MPLRLFLAAALAMGAAAASPAKAKKIQPQTDERLTARVQEYVAAWKAQDLHRVWLLYAPSYRRTTTEPAFYEIVRGMIDTQPLEARVTKIEREKDSRRAAVTVEAQQIVPPLGLVPSKLEFHWVYEQGDWYKLMDPPSFPAAPPAVPTPVR